MRHVLDREVQDPRTTEGVALLGCQVRKVSGAYAGKCGGLSELVFARSIGENEPPVRARICDRLGLPEMEREERRHAANEGVISAPASRGVVRAIRTDEEQMIAKAVCRVLGLG